MSPVPESTLHAIEATLTRADALHRAGDLGQADRLVRDLLLQFPACAPAWNRRGLYAMAQGNGLLARECFERAIEGAPHDASLRANLCELLRRAGLPERAITHGEAAVRIEPRHAAAHLNLGCALMDLGQVAQALAHFEAATRLDPASAAAWYGLARARHTLGADPTDALEHCIALAPDDAPVRTLQAQVLLQRGDVAGALAHAQRVLRSHPAHAEAIAVLADALVQDGDVEGAQDLLLGALRTMPATAPLRYRLALACLARGDYVEGFRLYESRLDFEAVNRIQQPVLPMPRWEGEPLNGRRLLVLTEQGYGDHLMFARFIPHLARAGARIVQTVSPALLDLMARVEGTERVMTLKDDARASGCDCWTFVGSLPHRLGVDATGIGTDGPYLAADAAKRQAWRESLATLPAGRRIGLVWSGRPDNEYERRRAVPFAALAALRAVPDVHFVGLTTETRPAPGSALAQMLPITFLGAADLGSFDDTAALIAELDLLIAVDTAYAHLAGAMGCPCWVLLPKAADWRWALDEATSPWYPSLRLFRQRRAGDWSEPIEQIAAALAA